MAFAWSTLWGLCAFVGLLLPTGGFCESCEAYEDSDGRLHLQNRCLKFCCGTCTSRYCCLDAFKRIDQFQCSRQKVKREFPDLEEEAMKLESDFSEFYSSAPSGAVIIAIGVSIFILSIVAIILCFTCSCCCLYKACRRPRQPVTTTTVVQVPYPQQQQPGIPATYPGVYQGYSPLPVQPHPGMPTAPYPTQYPPPYPSQPAGPPAYHETMAAGAGAPVVQPPYNPAYVDPPKSSY